LVPAERLSKALITGTTRSPRARLRAQLAGFFFVWVSLVTLGCLTVSAFADGAARNYQIDRLQSAYHAARQEDLVLQSEVAALTGPVHLLTVASALKYGTPASELVVQAPSPAPVVAKSRPASFWSAWGTALSRLHGAILRVLTAL
jgi:hypothetical protein